MRILSALGLTALALLAGAATPPRDWSAVASRTTDGAIVTGNPKARVKLVEYASYTCSHCAHFATGSAPVLKARMIRSGSTSLEFRHLIRDQLDLAAAIVARCAEPAKFSGTSEAIFAAQDDWLARGTAYDQANATALSARPVAARLRALADGSGLTAIGRARGLTQPALAACFADRGEIDRLVAMTNATPPEVRSTPTFTINGAMVDVATWSSLEPLLRAQGAK